MVAEAGDDADLGRALARRLIVVAAVCVALAAFTYLLMVRTHLGQRFDNAALIGSQRQSTSSRVHDYFFLERIHAATFAAVLLVIAGIGLIRRRPRLGIAIAGGALLAVAGTDLAKYDILTRPYLVATDAIRKNNTFPSGHTATAIACALALVVISPPAARGLVAILAGSYSWVVAADVQTAGWHRPSDAIGAAFLAFATIAVVAALLAWRRPVGTGRRTSHWVAYPVLGLVGILSASLTALNATRGLRILARTADAPIPPRSAVLGDAYRFSVNLTVFVVVVLLIVLLLLLDNRDLDQPIRTQ
ncbi:MAG TPA: phosphatase PAP2 family protein [Mycobacteriales bacterium]|nr:phosphatase PAP2 family protein [Mycobacteriales bacterium]